MPTSAKRQGVIFDLDGTLLNTLEDLANTMNHVLARRGWPEHPHAAYRHFVGNGVGVLVQRAMPEEHRSEALIDRVAQEMRSEYAKRWAEKTRLYEGVQELLQTLESLGIPMAILSNKPDDATREMVDHFFPTKPFRTVAGAKPEKPRKPDPTTALEIAAYLERDPRDILFLGDSDTDMLTAGSAAMVPLGAGWGFRGRTELLASGARKVLDKPLELLNWVNTA